MYVISSRKEFWDYDCVLPLNQDDMIREVGPRGKQESKAIADYESEINGKKVLLLCHGYNNRCKAVMRAYYRIQKMQSNRIKYFDVVVGYTWPGGGYYSKYSTAKKRAGSAVALRFVKLLETTISKCSELGVMSHSMGCMISLIAHKQLDRRGIKKPNKHWQFLMAASVNDQSIEAEKRYFNGTLYCDKTYVFHSKKDMKLGNWFQVVEKHPKGEERVALGYSGPKNTAAISGQTKIIDCTSVVSGHSGYKKNPEVYNYIHNELHKGYPAPKCHALEQLAKP